MQNFIHTFESFIFENADLYKQHIPEIVQYVNASNQKSINGLAKTVKNVPGINVSEYVAFVNNLFQTNQTTLVTAILNLDMNSVMQISSSIMDQILSYATKAMGSIGYLKKVAVRTLRPNNAKIDESVTGWIFEIGNIIADTQDLINEWGVYGKRLGVNPPEIQKLNFDGLFNSLKFKYVPKFDALITNL